LDNNSRLLATRNNRTLPAWLARTVLAAKFAACLSLARADAPPAASKWATVGWGTPRMF